MFTEALANEVYAHPRATSQRRLARDFEHDTGRAFTVRASLDSATKRYQPIIIEKVASRAPILNHQGQALSSAEMLGSFV